MLKFCYFNMTKFKMLGLDLGSSPIKQYKTWISEDVPDYEAVFFDGIKTSENLTEISAYLLPDDDTIADFHLPNPLTWSTTRDSLPNSSSGGQLAVIDGYVYIFGSSKNKYIQRAHVSNPTKFSIVGELPEIISSSQLAIVDNKIYLFGGLSYDGYASGTIYVANTNNPLSWENSGFQIPEPLYGSQLAIINNKIYLYGGKLQNDLSKKIYFSETSDPLSWEISDFVMPDKLCYSQLGIVDGYVYLFGGMTDNKHFTDRIYSASLYEPDLWRVIQVLPEPCGYGVFFPVGNRGYLIAQTSSTPKSISTPKIFRCELNQPIYWVDTKRTMPKFCQEGCLSIVGDRIYMYGGNGSKMILANDSVYKYNLGKQVVIDYGQVTRSEVQSTPTKEELFIILGFPYWKTDYGS